MQVVFPAAHVCLRLEQAAAGMWPEAGPVAEDEDAVQDTLLRVTCPFIPSLTEYKGMQSCPT